MKPLAADTPIDVEQAQRDAWLALPLGRRARLVLDLCETAQRLALAGLRLRHPGATDAQLRRLWYEQSLGPELAAKVFGPLPPSAASR